MLTLYGHPMSRAHRVMWLLREIGIPFEHVPTDFLRGGNKTPDFLRLNPNGKVPVLTDGEMSAVAPRHFDRRWRTDRYWNLEYPGMSATRTRSARSRASMTPA